MKKLNVVIMVLIVMFFSSNVFASTTLTSNLEINEDLNELINIPSPSEVLSIPLDFLGIFVRGFLLVIISYGIIDIVCKTLINSKRSFKTYLSHRKLGKIMDRMYEYKKEG